jgi:4-amino-4-deoxychorismate lyase
MSGIGNWWVNGEPAESVSILDRGFTYADGLFETVAVRDGKTRFLDYHLERLSDGCRRLAIPYPAGVTDELCSIAEGCRFGTAKIILTRGAGARGYAPPEKLAPTRVIGLIATQPPARLAYEAGVAVRLCDTKVSANSTLAGMKTLARLEQVMARSEWQDARISEGLMCSDDGQVICGTMTNLFFVANGRLCTSDVSRCGVSGVMRRVVMEQAGECGLDCIEVDIDWQDLYQVKEIFLTNSLIGIWPVRQLQDIGLEIGSITRRLMAKLVAIGVTECAI